MAALLKLSDYSAYWAEHQAMVMATRRLNPGIGDEIAAEFHRVHASKIVAPWISVLLPFHPMDELVHSFNHNLSFLQHTVT
jgi:hypothetical protein